MGIGFQGVPVIQHSQQARCPVCPWSLAGDSWEILAPKLVEHMNEEHTAKLPVVEPEPIPKKRRRAQT
jgi:hypothetical protein